MVNMKRGLFAAFLLPVLLASFPRQSIAKTNAIVLRWEELAGVAAGKDVELLLTDGTRLKGELLIVRPDALSIDVIKTSNKRIYPKGQREIPRAAVSEFEMRRLKNGALWEPHSGLSEVSSLGPVLPLDYAAMNAGA